MHDKFELHFTEKFGADFERFKDSLDGKPSTSIRFNPNKKNRGFGGMTPIPWAKNAFYLEKRPPFYADPLHHGGAYYVQEASSMFFSGALVNDRPLLVLDLCAAPGGKSSLLLNDLHPDSFLVSNEMDLARNRVLTENLNRWGRGNVVVTNANSKQFSALAGCFDLILIDAPCSGEGMFRKDKKALDLWSPNFVRSCAAVQSELIHDAVDLLKPGGMLIYSTCTFEKDENENQVLRALSKTGFKPVSIPTQSSWGVQESFIDHKGIQFPCYHLYFHKVRGEGQFVCAMVKSDGDTGVLPRLKRNPLGEVKKEERQLIDKLLSVSDENKLVVHENAVYAIPKAWQNEINWLKANLSIWKMGTKLGDISPRNFKPHHELALSELTNDFANRFDLDYQQAIAYLKKEEVKPDSSWGRGWGLATYHGVSLGWLKNIGTRLNNYYPKDLVLRKDIKKAELGELRL